MIFTEMEITTGKMESNIIDRYVDNKIRIGILTSPTEQASVIPISNLIEILKSLSKSIVIITGNASYDFFKHQPDIACYDNSHPMEKNLLKKIIYYLHAQCRDSYFLLKNRNNVEAWIFFMGGEREFIPILTAHLLKKPVLLYIPGSAVRDAKFSKDPLLKPTEILSARAHNLADYIILYSPNLISEWNLEPYRHKIIIASRHFLDINTFTVTIPFIDRPPLIGYIGRLSGEKGIQNFAKALPTILGNQQNLRVLIGGNGQLKGAIETALTKQGLIDKVDLPDWISHDDLPGFLNRLRLLVLPSYTEGLPNIMLEAMACGTPVLATPVGAIPDIIKDGETGFIMENNSPKCIAENVERALSSPHLETIANNGRRFVEKNFTFEMMVVKWKEILDLL